ncbi:MAG: DNA polymerase/3'-5' exonuclease PolX, partial [Bacteroidetes bacterium]|nr:DNA polymerase/3'-5' exonuclease PolX [Bacteroidota bacterium]
MAYDNYYIADQFALLAKLMDIHGENSFKSKSYSSAAFNIEKLPVALSETPADKLSSLKGVGDSVAKKVTEILQTGKLQALEDIILKTPPGVMEMLNIKGIGPKKIATIWKEMEIESLGELLYACNENRLMLFKGFGEKTQANVREAIEFYFRNQGSHLYAETEAYAAAVDKTLKDAFPAERFELTGEFRRELEIINQLEWVTTTSVDALKKFFTEGQYTVEAEDASTIVVKGPENKKLGFYTSDAEGFVLRLFETSSSDLFLEACRAKPEWAGLKGVNSDEELLTRLGLSSLPVYLREQEWALTHTGPLNLVTPEDIKAIIHSHSNWSDGGNTIEDMAKACIARGYEYLVISDHSKSAFYANGLNEERIREQHRYIDELNEKLKPFKIFKSIECDILNDGSLDYSDNILSTFDLVIASVHSNLKMTEEKAMARVLKAIANPYTTILGHPTGRLLLSRKGYPLDHSAIIDACAAHNVVIELNAHPRRLDMDWRWIHEATGKNVLISIDPDAHTIEGFDDCRYGVL